MLYYAHRVSSSKILRPLKVAAMAAGNSRRNATNIMGEKSVILLCCGSFNPPTYMHLRMFERARDHLEKVHGYKVIKGIMSPVSDAYQRKVEKQIAPAQHRVKMLELALLGSTWITIDTVECTSPQWSRTLSVLRSIRERYVGVSGGNADNSGRKDQSSDCHNHGPSLTTCRDRAPPPRLSFPLDSYEQRRSRSPFNISLSLPNILGGTPGSGSSRPIADSPAPVSAGKSSGDSACKSRSAHSGPLQPKVMLLCGSDILETFRIPNLWKDADIQEICGDFGLVIISRVGADAEQLIYESDLLSSLRSHIIVVNEFITNEISSSKIRRAIRRKESVRYLLPDKVLDYIHANSLYLLPPPSGL